MQSIFILLAVTALAGCVTLPANVQVTSPNGGVHLNQSGFGTVYTNNGSQITRGSNGQTSVRIRR